MFCRMHALVAAGQMPLSALPKIGDMRKMFPGLGSWGRPSLTDMHRHHLLEGRYLKHVQAHMSPAGKALTPSAEDIPAYIVEQAKHTGLGGIAPELTKAIGNVTDPRLIYSAHVEVYERLGHLEMLEVFKRWWSAHGLPIPSPTP